MWQSLSPVPWFLRRNTFPYAMSRPLCDLMRLQVLGASSTTTHVSSFVLSLRACRHELGSAVLSVDLSREALKKRSRGGDTHSMLAPLAQHCSERSPSPCWASLGSGSGGYIKPPKTLCLYFTLLEKFDMTFFNYVYMYIYM